MHLLMSQKAVLRRWSPGMKYKDRRLEVENLLTMRSLMHSLETSVGNTRQIVK